MHPDYKVGGSAWRRLRDSGLFDMDKPVAQFTARELHLLLQREPDVAAGGAAFVGVAQALLRRHEGTSGASRGADAPGCVMSLPCRACAGTRLNAEARRVRVGSRTLADLCALEAGELLSWLQGDDAVDHAAADTILEPLLERLQTMVDVGVHYLSLDRPVSTLSGGESQRLRMARRLRCGLVGLMYIMDEPSVGLHARDTARPARSGQHRAGRRARPAGTPRAVPAEARGAWAARLPLTTRCAALRYAAAALRVADHPVRRLGRRRRPRCGRRRRPDCVCGRAAALARERDCDGDVAAPAQRGR